MVRQKGFTAGSGDDQLSDQVRALSASSRESAEAAGRAHDVPLTFGSAGELAAHPDVDLVVIQGGPHGIPWTHADEVNQALLNFLS